jgi:hypothetical protein
VNAGDRMLRRGREWWAGVGRVPRRAACCRQPEHSAGGTQMGWALSGRGVASGEAGRRSQAPDAGPPRPRSPRLGAPGGTSKKGRTIRFAPTSVTVTVSRRRPRRSVTCPAARAFLTQPTGLYGAASQRPSPSTQATGVVRGRPLCPATVRRQLDPGPRPSVSIAVTIRLPKRRTAASSYVFAAHVPSPGKWLWRTASSSTRQAVKHAYSAIRDPRRRESARQLNRVKTCSPQVSSRPKGLIWPPNRQIRSGLLASTAEHRGRSLAVTGSCRRWRAFAGRG